MQAQCVSGLRHPPMTPNLREDSVSAALSREGEQQMIKAVLAVPPIES